MNLFRYGLLSLIVKLCGTWNLIDRGENENDMPKIAWQPSKCLTKIFFFSTNMVNTANKLYVFSIKKNDPLLYDY